MKFYFNFSPNKYNDFLALFSRIEKEKEDNLVKLFHSVNYLLFFLILMEKHKMSLILKMKEILLTKR